MRTLLKKRYMSPNHALNIHRRSEPVAMDTIYSNIPDIDNGATQTQFYVGCKNIVCDAYHMKTDKKLSVRRRII